MAPLDDLGRVNIHAPRSSTIKWVDEAKGTQLWEEGRIEEDLINLQNPKRILNHRRPSAQLKSALKVQIVGAKPTRSKFLAKTRQSGELPRVPRDQNDENLLGQA